MKTYSTKYNKWRTVLFTINLLIVKVDIVVYELAAGYPIRCYKVNRNYKLEIVK